MKSSIQSKKKRTARATAKLSESVEILTEKSAEVNHPENDKANSPVKNTVTIRGEMSVLATKPNINNKGKSCLDDGKISGEAGDDVEKQTETEKKMEFKDAMTKECSDTQDVKDEMVDQDMDVEVSVTPEEVEKKVISGETNVDVLGGVNTEKSTDESRDSFAQKKIQGTCDVAVNLLLVSQSKEVS